MAGSWLKLMGWLSVVMGGLLLLAGAGMIYVALDFADDPRARGSDDVEGLFLAGIGAAGVGAALLAVGTILAVWGGARAHRALRAELRQVNASPGVPEAESAKWQNVRLRGG
jgi:hypothetical protein